MERVVKPRFSCGFAMGRSVGEGTGHGDMSDLQDHRLIFLKGFLLLLILLGSAALIIVEKPTLKVAFLVAIAIWSAARLYYFAFYVIERYVDPRYKFAGIWSFLRYVFKERKTPK